MKKVLSLILVVVMVLSMAVAVSAATDKVIFVATDGNDSNAGSIDAPVATLKKAVELSAGSNAIINIRGGVYKFTEGVELTSANNNLVIKAYGDEEVTFTGAASLKLSDFKAVDGEAKERIVNGGAKQNVIAYDMEAAGITELGQLYVFDHGFDRYPNAPALYAGAETLTLSRYPNDDYLLVDQVKVEGKHMFDYYPTKSWPEMDAVTDEQFQITVADQQYKKWTKADDVWAFGYWVHDWAGGTMGVSVDVESGVITSKYPASFGVVNNRRFYFYNLLEEIDIPGEWYLDRTDKVLYVYPTKDFEKLEAVDFVTFNQPFISGKDCENVTIYNIAFEKAVGAGISFSGVKNLTVDSCELSLISAAAINISDATDSAVRNCYVHDVGAKGIVLNGGDRVTLTPGNNIVDNNKIERYAKIKTTYNSAIESTGVANTISHNVISDAPHMAINCGGNNNIVEYNEVSNVLKDTTDAGALYVGRDWTQRGNIIRYNYFHNIELVDSTITMPVFSIYLDDMFSSADAYGNVFYRVSSAALYGGGRYNQFRNNMMIDCGSAITIDSRGTTWMESGEGSEIRTKLYAMPYNEGVWKETYPELSKILEDEPELPKYNVVNNNLLFRSGASSIDPLAVEYGEVEADVEFTKSDIFADYQKKDFTPVLEKIHEKLPEFEAIPFTEIGNYEAEKPVFDENVAADTPAVDDGTIKVLLNGEKIDFADVAPQIINDRTMVPLRAIFEALGAEVSWDDESKTVTASKEDVEIEMTIGSDYFLRNKESVALDSPAVIVDSRTLVPVRAIAESFGCEVGWAAETKTVTITD